MALEGGGGKRERWKKMGDGWIGRGPVERVIGEGGIIVVVRVELGRSRLGLTST